MLNGGTEHENITLRRSIVIGIGGTGGEVIRTLRELIVSKFGGLDRLPIVKFLYLDTDTTWARVGTTPWGTAAPGSEGSDCPLCTPLVRVNAGLSGHEVVDLQVPDCDGLYAGIREGSHPHYGWFSLEKLQSIPNVTRGAGTVRQLGRLCFWQHRPRIENALRVHLQDLNSVDKADYMRERYRIELEPGVSVYIVTSLAGGTGSGCFLDMAYLAREVIDDMQIQGAIELVGYLVMPTAFAQVAGANALANGYAALKELNYLSYHHGPNQKLARIYSKPTWRAQYDAAGTKVVKYESTAPFRYCYLVDTGNEFVSTDREEVFTMIAMCLFREFTSELAAFRRSLRNNVRTSVNSNDDLDCPAEFLSVGHSFVYFPMNEARYVLAYRMAKKALDEWRGGGDGGEWSGASSVQRLLQAAVDELIQSKSLGQSDIVSSVLTCPDGTKVSDAANQLEREQPWASARWGKGECRDRLDEWSSQQKADFDDSGNDQNAWGSYMRQMTANANQALGRYWNDIQSKLSELDSKYGPAASLAFLERLSRYLQDAGEKLRKRAQDPKELADALHDVGIREAVDKDPSQPVSSVIEERMRQELERVEKAASGPFGWFKTESRIAAPARKCLQWLVKWCLGKTYLRAWLLAAELCLSLADRIQDELRRRGPFLRALDKIENQLVDTESWWNQHAATTRVVGLRLYDETILSVLDGKISELRKDAYTPKAVADEAIKLLGKPLKDLTDSDEDVRNAAHALFHAAIEAIGTLSEQDMAETRFAAYDLLTARYADDHSLESTLNAVAQKSAPYVRLEQDPPGGAWRPNEPYPMGLISVKQVGIHGGYESNDQDPDRLRVLTCLGRLSNPLWNLDDDVMNVTGTEHILFMQECGGFPLRALSAIDEMKKAYDDHRRYPTRPPLHIVRDEMAYCFPEIVPPKPEDLEHACRLRDGAIKCGLIQKRPWSPESGGVNLEMYLFQKPGADQGIVLGDTEEAIVNHLIGDPDLAREVEAALEAFQGTAG